MRIIDLSQPLDGSTPAWPGDPPFRRKAWASIDHDGYNVARIELGEHTGTHIGVEAHIRNTGTTSGQINPELLVLPAVVIDMHDAVRADPDSRLTPQQVEAWEHRNGTIPSLSAVLVLTGWSARWGRGVEYFNADHDGVHHTPGVSLEAAHLLAGRGVIALGIDGPGIDAGTDVTFSVNAFWLKGQRYHIENLRCLDMLPEVGARIVVGALPIEGGSGAPARVLAFVELNYRNRL